MSIGLEGGDDARFERFVREETGGGPVSPEELHELKERFDELCLELEIGDDE